MVVQIGTVRLDKVENQQILPNKTRKYLLPCLKEYGEEFVSRLNNVFKVAVGLGDMIVEDTYYIKPERHLFILIDSKIAPVFFFHFLEWVRTQDVYEDDYVYGNILKSTFHMVIIKFPEQFYDAFETFKKGKYSEMFTEEQVQKLFISKDNTDAPKVLLKDRNYNIVFTRRLNRMFNAQLKDGEYDGELDLPPNIKEETFNS